MRLVLPISKRVTQVDSQAIWPGVFAYDDDVLRSHGQPKHSLNSYVNRRQSWHGISVMTIRNVVQPKTYGTGQVVREDAAEESPIRPQRAG